MATFENTNPTKLLIFLNFGPNFDLGASIQSTVKGSGTFEGTVKKVNSATWIPDDDGKVFCGALTNTMGRKVIRKLSDKTAYMRVMDDTNCLINSTKCENDECAPSNTGGIAIYLQPELFGNGAGQIPNPNQAGKQIHDVELLLSLGNLVKDVKEDEKWIVQSFTTSSASKSCVKDSLSNASTTVEINQLDRDEGRVTVDVTEQLRELAQSSVGSIRGVYIVRADITSPMKKELSFLSTTILDSKKRPQLIAGITDGDSPPIALIKGETTCPQGTHIVCTANEVQSSVGFDGYDERKCGTMEKDNLKVDMRITTSNVLETCDKTTGVFCCAL